MKTKIRVMAIIVMALTAAFSMFGYELWDAGKTYSTAGSLVEHNGNVYENKWWTQGENPEQSGQWGVWKLKDDPDPGPPIANNDTATTNEERAVTVNVLENDTGKGISISNVSSPSNGTALISGSSIAYTPNSGFIGTDSFTYTIKDSIGQTSSANVTVTVNKEPHPDPDIPGWDAGKTYVGADKVTYNDKIYEAKWWTQGDNPEQSGQWGVWKLVDPDPNPDPPIASNDTATTNEEQAVTVNVLANDKGDGIKIQSVTQPQHGSVANTDSTVTYTPAEGYTGNDSFNYTIVDSNSETASAVVDVTVNEKSAPVANDDTANVYKNTPQEIDVLANDTGEGLTVNSVTQPANGTVVIKDNKAKYTPNTDYIGQDAFEYTVKNSFGLIAVGFVAVTVKDLVVLDKINATFYCAWGGNTSYVVDGKKISSAPVEMDKIDPSYNVIITAFIEYHDGEYGLQLNGRDPAIVKNETAKTKAQGRKVLVSLGGAEFKGATVKTQIDVDNLVRGVKSIVDEYGFEGLDIDLEASILGPNGTNINPQLLGEAITQIVDHYKNKGIDFWLTAAPEWAYIIPYMWGSGQWASHELFGDFYKNLFDKVGLDNFNYIWPQSYNGGAACGVAADTDKNKILPTEGMDKFLAALAWGISTPEGYEANGSKGVIIPADKLCLGIPATEGAAGGHMTYVATPELIKSAWKLMTEQNSQVSGFMNWSADWDAMNIADGDLSEGYTHSPWETGHAVAEAMDIDSSNQPPVINMTVPANNAVIEFESLSAINLEFNAVDSDGEIASSAIKVDGKTFNGTSASWTPDEFGTYNITFTAVDNDGAAVNKTINITVKQKGGGSNQPPVISSVSPANGETIEMASLSPVALKVNASDPDGTIADVKIEVDGKTFSGSSASWTPSEFGTHTIYVTVTDNKGATASSIVNVNIEKSVDPYTDIKFVSPKDGDVIKLKELSLVNITISVSETESVESVAINVDGNVFDGYTANWIPSDFGTFTITAMVTYLSGSIEAETINIKVTEDSIGPDGKKQIIGYFPTWDVWKGTDAGLPAAKVCNQLNIDYSKYTMLNYSFFGVAKDGSLHSADLANKKIWEEGQVQEPGELICGKVYDSYDYWLLYGELDLLWSATQESIDAGFVVDGTNWHNTKTGLSGEMPIPMPKEGGAPGLFKLCKDNNVKLIATIGGWSMCKHFPEMAADPVKKQNFLNNCKRLIAMGFDGIDIDWEFPGPFPGMNFIGTDADFPNFTSLMEDIRAVIGPDKLLIAAFSCVPERIEKFEWEKLNKVMDHFNMMTYDMEGGWSLKTAHHSPLYPQVPGGLSWDTTFKYLTEVKKIPAEKINLGTAFYGRGLITDGDAYLGAPTVKVAKTILPDGPIVTAADYTNWGAYGGAPNYAYIMQKIDDWAYHWDDVSKVPYLTKDNYFVTYDDIKSIGLKADYIVNNNAGGVILWNVFGDIEFGEVETNYANKLPQCSNNKTPLLDTLHNTFNK